MPYGMWRSAVCQLDPTTTQGFSCDSPSRNNRNPISSALWCLASLLLVGASLGSPLSGIAMQWDGMESILCTLLRVSLACFSPLFTLVSPPLNPTPCVCLWPPLSSCRRQVNFRSCTVIGTNYARTRSLQETWTDTTATRRSHTNLRNVMCPEMFHASINSWT
jgi:hypothetical protein